MARKKRSLTSSIPDGTAASGVGGKIAKLSHDPQPQEPPITAGKKRSSSSAFYGDGKTVKQSDDSQPQEARRKCTADDLTPSLSLATSAISLSLRFITGGSGTADLLLLPSQTLTLESSVHAAAVSLARLISLLGIPPQTLNLSPDPSPQPSWFARFLSSSSTAGDHRWGENFRMSKPSFYLLLQTLSPSLRSSSAPIPLDHKLGAALFRLAHAAPFPAVARRFGLPSPDLACRAFYEVCKAVADQLGHLFELSSDLTRVLQGFHWMSLPNCCGALGFSRFAGEASVVAQAVVDSEGRFLDVSAGWRSSMPPAEILPRTKLYSSQAVVLAGGPPLQLNGVGSSVPRYFLGGSCCPLLPWLLTPFAGNHGGGAAAVFNVVHGRGMELVHRAFGRLRARWQLLRGVWKEECAEALPFVIVAACLLHNYLIKCSEPLPEDWEAVAAEVESGFPEFEGTGDEAGEKIRGALASHLSKVIGP
ncbi:hypothetical protein AXF42_Ash002857 [Apostasia shenzhenica]|uniref:DDE Tnp4 domain-containing protein n=1 Tax=Apostasia shenzhenica TaxID=1088818 RepID=A0A2I0A7H1_9ASPA|nr:hypothetical protein AXF42_Ash002857 [Apostasia shenzhenica]